MTILAWIATISTGALLSATMIQGLLVLNYESYTFERWHGTLLGWAVVLVSVFFNTVIGMVLPKVEGAFLILHILGFFAILIPLVYYGPHGTTSDVFGVYLNEGGWSSYGLSFMVGTLGLAFSFVGADAAVHVCSDRQVLFRLTKSLPVVRRNNQPSGKRSSFNSDKHCSKWHFGLWNADCRSFLSRGSECSPGGPGNLGLSIHRNLCSGNEFGWW